MSKKHPNRIRASNSMKLFQVLGYLFLLLIGFFCLVPFLLIVSASFSSETAITRNGFSLFPQEFSLEAYKMIFRFPDAVVQAYGVSIFVTVVGTVLGLLVTAMTAYVLSRPDFKYRNQISFFFYFTTLFNGGMVCTYIFIIRYLQLKNSYASLIFPTLIDVFYLLIMRSFMKAVPISLIESAKLDGASEYRIFFQIALPLAKAGLVTIGLFIALNYWNDWYNAMLYISKRSMWPLQYMLYDMISSTQMMAQLSSVANVSVMNMPSQTLRMAMAVVATGPAILVYPFVQKYFVKGVTIGAVKG
ncbi:MAG: carbohydrate ABC transporter permease [Gemmiger sp.]|nr:carbohydrate ABC transporter permease [Gemmiger sp.]